MSLSRCHPVFFSLLLLLLLAACESRALPTLAPRAVPLQTTLPPPPTPPVTLVTELAEALPLPTRSLPPAITPPPTTTAVPRIRLGAAPGVPVELVAAAQAVAARQPHLFTWAGAGAADVTLVVNEGEPLAGWLYAVVAPFATVADEIGAAELAAVWRQSQSGQQLFLEPETAAAWQSAWQASPAAATLLPEAELIAGMWQARPSLSLVPFHRLSPELKVLRLDGRSPLDPEFDPGGYPLLLTVGLTGDAAAVSQFKAVWDGPAGNYRPDRLTRVAMTGVTALTRAVAYQMEIRGVTYPGEAVGPILRAADIAHISHEVPFATDCPYPNPVGGATFCARDQYLELLQNIGTSVVELTGNHVNDWGAHNLAHTIDLYEAAGMQTFGGGRDLASAARPALFEHNGNRIAFTGCNPVGPAYAWATESRAGSRPCHYDALFEEMGQLRQEGYFVIATLQYWEFYHYAATPQQKADFRRLAEAGAHAVSGSQAHHPQSFDFHQGAFIHHGLGNLFFDQMDMLGTRQAVVDIYTIVDGRLLNVELWTGLIENWSRPRPATAAEREQLLRAMFQASGW
jgi:poly-gamma-glutamate capsule biosynthesis protein CapA/YwtB (metallophosphatase superfamily)